MFRALSLAAVVAALLPVAGLGAAEATGVCEGCGNRCCLKPVCRLVCETKTVTETHYDCKREDFCLPGRSQRCGCECIPTCGQPRTRKLLVKYETMKEVPSYKCVVDYVCCHCCQRLSDAGELVDPARAEGPVRAASTLPAHSQIRQSGDTVIVADHLAQPESIVESRETETEPQPARRSLSEMLGNLLRR